jgi:hypothetical protein
VIRQTKKFTYGLALCLILIVLVCPIYHTLCHAAAYRIGLHVCMAGLEPVAPGNGVQVSEGRSSPCEIKLYDGGCYRI